MWTSTARQQYSRGELRYESDLSDKKWRLIVGWMPAQKGRGRPLAWSWRGRECDFLYAVQRLSVEVSASGFSAVADGLPLVRRLP